MAKGLTLHRKKTQDFSKSWSGLLPGWQTLLADDRAKPLSDRQMDKITYEVLCQSERQTETIAERNQLCFPCSLDPNLRFFFKTENCDQPSCCSQVILTFNGSRVALISAASNSEK